MSFARKRRFAGGQSDVDKEKETLITDSVDREKNAIFSASTAFSFSLFYSPVGRKILSD